MRKMAAAGLSRARLRPRPRGRCGAPHLCVVGQIVTAVTELVYFELCFLNNSCFVFFLIKKTFLLPPAGLQLENG